MSGSSLLFWTFHIPLTADNTALVTKVEDFVDFPVDRIASLPSLNWLLHPYTPVAIVLGYLVSIPLLWTLLGGKSKEEQNNFNRSIGFRSFVALHNLILVVYSVVSFINSFDIVWRFYSDHGSWAVYCDHNKTMWNDYHLREWTILFYLSKYYEFIDTYILILKGKWPSLLQVYHHAGIVLIFYGCVVTQGSWSWWATVLNSLIHSLMYTYYFLTSVGVKVAGAQMMTTLQLIQFATGTGGTIMVYYYGDSCTNASERFVLGVFHGYTVFLVSLFVQFYVRRYYAHKNKKSKGAGKKTD